MILDLSKVKPMKPVQNNRNLQDYDSIKVIGMESDLIVFEGTISEAVKFIKTNKDVKTVLPPSSIFKSASGWFPVVYGYAWKFKDEIDENEFNIFASDKHRNVFLEVTGNSEPIVMFSRSGEPKQAFENMFMAMKFLKDEGKSPDYRTVLAICKKHSESHTSKTTAETAFGYQWMFYKDAAK